jgi:hypothetical protein
MILLAGFSAEQRHVGEHPFCNEAASSITAVLQKCKRAPRVACPAVPGGSSLVCADSRPRRRSLCGQRRQGWRPTAGPPSLAALPANAWHAGGWGNPRRHGRASNQRERECGCLRGFGGRRPLAAILIAWAGRGGPPLRQPARLAANAAPTRVGSLWRAAWRRSLQARIYSPAPFMRDYG